MEDKTGISEIKKQLDEARGALLQAQEKEKETGEQLSKAETNKKIADFALTRNKNNRTWLILLCVGLGFIIFALVVSLYWQKSPTVHNFIEGFNYNGVPKIAITVGAVITAAAVFLLILKINGRKKLYDDAMKADGEYDRCSGVHDEALGALAAAEARVEEFKSRYSKAENDYLEENPEEKKKKLEEEKKEKDAAIAELKRIEEINAQAALDAEKKRKDRLEADKMFEHPQAYVLDGKYENEYEVYKAAADMGSPEAQERVVSYLLGLIYKNGVKSDAAKGEELALRYVSEGNYAMYEMLGKGYLYGEGVMPKDEKKGFYFLEKASVKGRQQAMLMAGVCCYNGVGTEKDVQAARGFFAKAARQGNEQAIRVVAAIDNGEKLRL